MKALKITAAVILSAVLLTAECIAMGLFSVDRAFDRSSIEEAVRETDIADRLVNEALQESTVNMGGRYGDMVKAVLQTDAMTDFFTDYIDNAIRHEIYGGDYAEVADDELIAAFNKGIEEVNDSGSMVITDIDGEMIKRAMQAEAPDLTAGLNQQIGTYDSISGDMIEDAADHNEAVSVMVGRGAKAAALIICAAVCAAIIALMWRSRAGFIWCAAVTALSSFIFCGLQFIGADLFMDIAASSAAEEMMLSMAAKGLGSASIAGLAVTVLFIIAFIILKIKDRRNHNEKNTAPSERTA